MKKFRLSLLDEYDINIWTTISTNNSDQFRIHASIIIHNVPAGPCP